MNQLRYDSSKQVWSFASKAHIHRNEIARDLLVWFRSDNEPSLKLARLNAESWRETEFCEWVIDWLIESRWSRVELGTVDRETYCRLHMAWLDREAAGGLLCADMLPGDMFRVSAQAYDLSTAKALSEYLLKLA